MEILTHSKRLSFKTCPRHYYHRHEQHLGLRREKTGRRRGSLFGTLIFAVHEEGRLAPSLLDFMRPIADAFYAEILPDSTEEAWELEVEQCKVEVMAAEYIVRYGIDQRRELTFDLPLRNPTTGGTSRTFRDGGKIDGVVTVGPRKVRVIEDKFVGQIQKAMIDRLPLDEQSSQYVDAFAQLGWEAEVAYRHTLYPGINPTKQKVLKTKTHPAETIDGFRQRLIEDIAARPAHYFNEQILVFPTEHLDDFRRGKWSTAHSIMAARLLARSDWKMAFPQSAGRCHDWGGCEFIPLCTRREEALDLYVVGVDNPELDTGGASDGTDA